MHAIEDQTLLMFLLGTVRGARQDPSVTFPEEEFTRRVDRGRSEFFGILVPSTLTQQENLVASILQYYQLCGYQTVHQVWRKKEHFVFVAKLEGETLPVNVTFEEKRVLVNALYHR